MERLIVISISSLSNGRAQRRTLTRACAFAARGHRVDLVVLRQERPDAPLVAAIASVLDSPPKREQLRARADQYSANRAAERYLNVLLGVDDAVRLPSQDVRTIVERPVLRRSNLTSNQKDCGADVRHCRIP